MLDNPEEIKPDIIYNNLNIDSDKIIQDKRIKIKLKEHQKTRLCLIKQGKLLPEKRKASESTNIQA